MVDGTKSLLCNFSKQILQKNYIFLIRKDTSFCDLVLKAVAVLDKTLEIYALSFFNFNSFFSLHIFHFKGALSCLRHFLATESPLKMMKDAFYFNLKPLFIPKMLKSLS